MTGIRIVVKQWRSKRFARKRRIGQFVGQFLEKIARSLLSEDRVSCADASFISVVPSEYEFYFDIFKLFYANICCTSWKILEMYVNCILTRTHSSINSFILLFTFTRVLSRVAYNVISNRRSVIILIFTSTLHLLPLLFT